jgi:hypothetical protein
VLTTCQPSTVWCSRERLPAAAAQPAKVRQSCSATDFLVVVLLLLYQLYSDPSGCAFQGVGLLRLAGIEGSNTARGMDVCLLCLYIVLYCVGRDLCDGLITRPEES